MSDDYLWDRRGPADPDIERLERMLEPFKARRAEPAFVAPTAREPRPSARLAVVALALAATLLLVLFLRHPASVSMNPSRPGAATASSSARAEGTWTVARLQGSPLLDRVTAVDHRSPLPVGTRLSTDAVSRARLVSQDVGEVIVEPASRVRLVASAAGRAHLALERGELQAFIVAPPGRFVVDTPSATAVDLGCVYTLRVGEDGDGLLSVTAGWVAFEFEGRESFVPAGASCPTHPATGPGLPRFDDASLAFVGALEKLERSRQPAERAQALRGVLVASRPRDAMTLWHIIPRVAPGERPEVVRRLRALVPLPDGVDVGSVLRLDQAALDHWWDALGLGEARTWREWKRPLPLTR